MIEFLIWLNIPCDVCHIVTCDGFCDSSSVWGN